MDLCRYLSCLSFYLLYFVLPPFEDNGLLFWVSDVFCQHSEVVVWNLLGAQMFFWWICGGESGLPVLFLCHFRTSLPSLNYFYGAFLLGPLANHFGSPGSQSILGFPGGTMVKDLPANAGGARDTDPILGSGRSSEVGNTNPLQYSCWKIPWINRVAW